MSQKVLDALKAKFPIGSEGAIVGTETQHGDEVVLVKRDKLKDIATWLRDDAAMAFDTPVFVTAIDLLDWRPVQCPGTPSSTRPEWDGVSPRFEVCWQLRSLPHRHRLRIKVALAENDVKVPSLTYLWEAFGWQERETFDMYGIEFQGHPDLRRIYMYDEFVGYPLRKDYPKEKRQPLVRRPDLVGDH